jgi:hypothetical protein
MPKMKGCENDVTAKSSLKQQHFVLILSHFVSLLLSGAVPACYHSPEHPMLL